MALTADINNTIKKLVQKAKDNGLYENFGQKELRKLIENFQKMYGKNYLYINSTNIYFSDKRKQNQMMKDLSTLKQFRNWIERYNGR